MRVLRTWLGVAVAAAATLYGAYLAQGWSEPARPPEWHGRYLDLLYLDLFSVLGSWVTVGILGLLTALAAVLVLRRQRMVQADALVPAVKPAAEAPLSMAVTPLREPPPAAGGVSLDRIARAVGVPVAAVVGSGAGPAGEMSPAERLLAEALAKVQRERAGLPEAPPRNPPSLRLVPQVPVRGAAGAAAWFGGGAQLPEGRAWPEIDGEALQLLAQINCARLPADLWGGLGPREGWLAIFLGPQSLKARVLFFMEAGPFQPSPAILKDANIVHPGMWKSDNALRPGAIPAFPRWPVELTVIEDGQSEPRSAGRSRGISATDYLDVTEPRYRPFDWPSAQMMMQLALDCCERSAPQPEAAPDPASSASLDKLRDLKAATDIMAQTVPFSADIVAAIIAEVRSLPAFQPRIPPKRDLRKAPGPDGTSEPGPSFAKAPAKITFDPATDWQVPYVTHLQDRAKHIHSAEAGPIPAPLLMQCEELWRDCAAHEMGAMGHKPWGRLRNFDEKDEVLLLELPSSQLMNWHFGNAGNLVLTIRKEDLALGDFGRVVAHVSG